MAAETTLACPNCKQTDAVRKVSALVSEDTVTMQYGTQQATSKTQLAKKLAQPARPEAGMNFGVGCLVFFLYLAMWVYCSASFSPTAVTGSDSGVRAFAPIAPYVFGVIFLILLILTFRWATRKDRVRLQPLMSAWEKATLRWNSLFYCGRCDGVFDPSVNRFVPAGQMQSYLTE